MNTKIILLFFSLFVLFITCKKYDPYKERIEDDFLLFLDDTVGVRADASTSITINLTNTKEVKHGLQVSFETNKGTLLQSTVPYENNQAQTKLLLTLDTGIYSVKATVKDGSEAKVIKIINFSFRKAYNPTEYNLSVADSTMVRANGKSILTLLFSTSAKLKEGLHVDFSTTRGDLIQSDIPFTNGMAISRLRVSQDTGIYVVNASVKDGDDVRIEKSITFSIRVAHPDSVLLELNRSTWNLNDAITIKTLLFRADGKVSLNQRVSFRAYQNMTSGNNINVGRFEGLLNNVTTASGMLSDITLKTDTPNIDTTKVLFIEASAVNDHNDTIRTTTQLPYKGK